MTAMRRSFPIICSLLWLLAAWLCPSRAWTQGQDFQILAVADPPRVVYAADNNVILTVTVNQNGMPAPDGTQVFFNTTLGSLPTVAYTQQGKVSVVVENSAGPGMAIVTITVGASRQTLRIEYLGAGGKAVSQAKRISYRLTARQIYYSADQQLFDLKDGASFVAPNFTVTADALQFNITQGILCAQQNVTITNGKKTVTGRNLHLIVTNTTGELIIAEPDISYNLVQLPSLEVREDELARQADFAALNPLPTKTWILCKEAVIYPDTQIHFRGPRFYLDSLDRCLYKLPYHVLYIHDSATGSFFNSKLSLTSDAGVNVDFPIYYAANDTHVGSLHLRQVTKGASSYTGTAGLDISIEEEYLAGQNGDGGLYLTNLNHPTRSLSWDHAHDFGDTQIGVTGAYERYTLDTPYTTRAGLSVNHPIGRIGTALTTNWSRFDQSQYGAGEFSLSLPGLPLGRTGMSLGVGPYLGLQHNTTQASGETPAQKTTNFYQGLRSDLTLPGWRFLGGDVSTNLVDEISHSNDVLTNYFDVGLNYHRRLSSIFSSTFSYGYSVSHVSGATEQTPANQRVSLSLSGHAGRDWSMNAYCNYNLDDQSFFNNFNTTYYLPWYRRKNGEPRLFAQYAGHINSTTSLTNADHLMSLGCRMGTYSLVLHYSPSGNTAVTGIGSGTGKHWSVELMQMGW